ncbi:hypothetical protein AVEN_68091-1 [Araneus ventricosus]|uniref:Uncharacterized protein n=1 Tax=Araneus ventricosus TaxID=182803 RepID=A0A4Y2A9K0_ARAVE|nr:hypothetical protein AVEN_75936-1 [Araneus ventricosus]GBL75612.1 hypothetical protein AVEN_93792-1 [Araneus ventricosus]GBO12509.1 hypothetical protein AVEN_68091-1 [Araneus ventricosus]
MDILRDTGASIGIVSRNHVRPEHFTGEVVYIKQPLYLNFKCLPLAKVELQSPEFGYVITKTASREREGTVASAKEPEAVVTEDPNLLILPPAEKIVGRLVEVSGEELREAQRGCSTLQACFLQAERRNSDFRVEGEMLFRESKDHFGSVSLQVVIPKVYRDKILALCHEELRRTSVYEKQNIAY